MQIRSIKGIEGSLTEGGKIKIGGLGEPRQSQGGKTWRPPRKDDHFTITKTVRDQNGDLIADKTVMDALKKDSSGKLTEIPIILYGDTIEDCFVTSYAIYQAKKCACRGDGEKALRREIKDGVYTGNDTVVECPCRLLNAKEGHKCKPNGKLFCTIIAPGAAVAGSVHIWRTTSIISIRRMIGSLEQILNICGTLRGIPLVLKVAPVDVDNGTVKSRVYCCHVELRESDIASVQRKALESVRLRRELGYVENVSYKRLLAAPADDDDESDIQQEFYPEEIQEPQPEPENKKRRSRKAEPVQTTGSEELSKKIDENQKKPAMVEAIQETDSKAPY